MTRKTAAQKRQETLEAENALNTTPEGVLVRPGQIWRDLNARSSGRMLSIVSVKAGVADVFDRKRHGKIAVSRLRSGSRGYEIWGSP